MMNTVSACNAENQSFSVEQVRKDWQISQENQNEIFIEEDQKLIWRNSVQKEVMKLGTAIVLNEIHLYNIIYCLFQLGNFSCSAISN